MQQTRRVAVVGGGISGLTAAYLLHRESLRRELPLDVTLLEKSDRLGGVIRSEHAGGCLLEWGPENFVPFKPKILELIREVGLADEVIGSNDHRRRTYVRTPRGLQPLPDGMAFLTPVDPIAFFRTRLLGPRGKLRAMLEPLVPRSRGELSVRQFLARRLGAQFTETIAEPLISAIYGGDIDRLSAGGALASSVALEQRFGSLWRGMRKASRRSNGSRGSMFYSLRNGMSELVHALQRALPPGAILLGIQGLKLSRADGSFRLEGEGFEGRFDAVALCSPAAAAGELLEPLLPGAGQDLRQVPYSSTSLLYLAYPRDRFSHPLDGFGFVAQRGAARVLDACTWVSAKFDGRCPEDRVLLRCAVHDGRWKRSSRPDEELADEVSRELKQALGISCDPDFWRVHHVRRGMPQPDLEHQRRSRRIERELESLPGLHLAGGYRGGVGLPDCVATAADTVERVLGGFAPKREI